uniref:NADH-ubiquinone oxidoreductase chain 1 n=1 Tax=Hydra vulgaris TaxID=6087 RepID=A0A0H5ATW3_HYDVU|nr:NADH dehydrogenase subunit 1 [Hydra vulgaris]BAR90978.1 NADH dehydrogenase subunit 1 [Hydra vulgaris]
MKNIYLIILEIIKFLTIIIPVLISVAYLTLAERKILGYSQNRKGPNVVGIYGLLQPLADGVKLFSKELIIPNHVNIFLYLFSPILALSLSLLIWIIIPLGINNLIFDFNLGIMFIFAISSINIYSILLSGWSSNSKYAFLGSLRAAAQMISYEVCISLIIFSCILCAGTLNIYSLINSQSQSISYIFPLWPIAIMFFICLLAETNRAPFDLTEGESELVSGYNVEYSSMSFALFFLAEYSHIIFSSAFFVILFLGNWNNYFFINNFIFFLKMTLFIFLFIWVRTSFPRLRYDQLMSLLWKSYLPLSLSFIIITNSLLWAFWGLSNKWCI